MNLEDVKINVSVDTTKLQESIEKIRKQVERMTEETRDESLPPYNYSAAAGHFGQWYVPGLYTEVDNKRVIDDLPDYEDITPDHLYTQETIGKAAETFAGVMLDNVVRLARGVAFYRVQLRLAGIPEELADKLIVDWQKVNLGLEVEEIEE